MIDSVKLIDGVKCYALDLAYQNDGFPRDAFEKLYHKEEKNFWFRSRNRIIRFLVNKYLRTDAGKMQSFLEIGCGTGFVLKGLSSLGYLRLVGADIYLEGLKYLKQRVPEAEAVQVDATKLPFENEFAAVGAFDALEHINDDQQVIKGVYRALKPEGYFFLTVPQHQFLWSRVDEIACHKRRYLREDLVTVLKGTGFHIEFVGSFLFLLFPVMLVSRLMQKWLASLECSSPVNEFNSSRLLNGLFEQMTRIDEWLIRLGVSLPFGGSLVVICKKVRGQDL